VTPLDPTRLESVVDALTDMATAKAADAAGVSTADVVETVGYDVIRDLAIESLAKIMIEDFETVCAKAAG
jgi:hypothetical protein